jgi:hypothetical protein
MNNTIKCKRHNLQKHVKWLIFHHQIRGQLVCLNKHWCTPAVKPKGKHRTTVITMVIVIIMRVALRLLASLAPQHIIDRKNVKASDTEYQIWCHFALSTVIASMRAASWCGNEASLHHQATALPSCHIVSPTTSIGNSYWHNGTGHNM